MTSVQSCRSTGGVNQEERKKAYRKRQNDYIHELERRLANANQTDNERINQLERENDFYRKQLAALSSKLETARSAIQGMSKLTNSGFKCEIPSENKTGKRNPRPSNEPSLLNITPINTEDMHFALFDSCRLLPSGSLYHTNS